MRQPRRTGEEGGVLLMVALWLPVLVLFLAFVIDVGNWFEHKRHLQTQADAAALAAAGDFRIPCTDTPIVDQAMQYSGFTGQQFNQQVGGAQPRTHIMINSPTFYNQGNPVDSTVRTGGPCTAGMVDVKLTETNLPWYFGFGKVVKFVNAHARVEIKPLLTQKGALPIGVPDVNPVSGQVSLVDEGNNGAVLNTCGGKACQVPLKSNGTINGFQEWDNVANPFSSFVMPSGVTRVGVRVTLSGTSDLTCGDPLVSCYDTTSSAIGLNFIQGYSTSGSGAQPAVPILRGVSLVPTGLCDAHFISTSCTFGIQAQVDMGSSLSLPSQAGIRATVNGVTHLLSSYNAVTKTWSSAANETFTVSTASAGGEVPVTLEWAENSGSVTLNGSSKNCSLPNGGDKFGGSNKCQGSFGTVQATYAASQGSSGPIQVVETTDSNGATVDSLPQGGTATNLIVRVGVKGSLQYAATKSDTPTVLRLVGNQNQSLDCDPGYTNLKLELASGCRPQYAKNTGTSCPTQSILWGSTPQPWQCVAIDTGNATNQVSEGMNLRILGSSKPATCTAPNHWNLFPDLPVGDPRIVPVFLTPFGSFNGTGNNTTVAVENFAFFYVTGWSGKGNGFNNPCEGNGDDAFPPGSCNPSKPTDNTACIIGHFIKYVQTINTNGGGPGFCDLSTGSLNTGACVAVLTQ